MVNNPLCCSLSWLVGTCLHLLIGSWCAPAACMHLLIGGVCFRQLVHVCLLAVLLYFFQQQNGALAKAPFFISASECRWYPEMQTSQTSQALALTPLSLLHLCAKYLWAQFQNKLNLHSSDASAMPLSQPLLLPVALVSELDIIAATLADAFVNRH